MSGVGTLNLKVVIMDTDFYALQAINSYLAWDRRTRVMHLSNSLADLWAYLRAVPTAEQPNIIVLEAEHIGKPAELAHTINDLRHAIPDVMIMCVGHTLDIPRAEAAAEAHARGYLLKHEVGIQIAWALVYALRQDFVVTASIARASQQTHSLRLFQAVTLPERRKYPEMTERVRQAIQLCVVEGMPAHLAADEMGISLHTVRGYIKEGYRILETYDQTDYPHDMTPQERAFMRFTALAEAEDEAAS